MGKENIKQKLRLILSKWNPIEIYPLFEAEYDYEINRIVEKLDEWESSAFEIGIIIHNVFKDSFGDIFDKTIEECTLIAKEFLE